MPIAPAMHPLSLAQVDLLTNVGSILAASPPILFFFLGAIARLAKSNLHVPKPVTKLLSLYLLWAIGFSWPRARCLSPKASRTAGTWSP